MWGTVPSVAPAPLPCPWLTSPFIPGPCLEKTEIVWSLFGSDENGQRRTTRGGSHRVPLCDGRDPHLLLLPPRCRTSPLVPLPPLTGRQFYTHWVVDYNIYWLPSTTSASIAASLAYYATIAHGPHAVLYERVLGGVIGCAALAAAVKVGLNGRGGILFDGASLCE